MVNNAPIITDIYMVHKLKQDIKSGDDGKYLLFLSFFLSFTGELCINLLTKI